MQPLPARPTAGAGGWGGGGAATGGGGFGGGAVAGGGYGGAGAGVVCAKSLAMLPRGGRVLETRHCWLIAAAHPHKHSFCVDLIGTSSCPAGASTGGYGGGGFQPTISGGGANSSDSCFKCGQPGGGSARVRTRRVPFAVCRASSQAPSSFVCRPLGRQLPQCRAWRRPAPGRQRGGRWWWRRRSAIPCLLHCTLASPACSICLTCTQHFEGLVLTVAEALMPSPKVQLHS